MKLKHTPYTWEPRERVVGTYGDNISHECIICVIPDKNFAPRGFADWKYNANLIAAAPEMLDALIEHMKKYKDKILFEKSESHLISFREMINAIEKATDMSIDEVLS
jgi:hypothetical protein